MRIRFDTNLRIIRVVAGVFGPSGNLLIRLAIDTGATRTLIRDGVLHDIGCDPTAAIRIEPVLTPAGVIDLPVVRLDRLSALGTIRSGFEVACGTMPANAPIDGFLGLDFLRRNQIVISFEHGFVELS